ncbi:MCE family protein [Nocardioides limicola]|uniref:MCE family protein n=1 Tax=Nocardioides limicola TaxID=2803368 RepID=UPI00193B660F|nr:MCE family protein [Nocardioides sp. DJM-14]
MRLRTLRTALPAVALTLGLSACGTTLADLPLPGSSVAGDTVTLLADFDDALNLAVGAPVKVNGVDSGKVGEVTVSDFRAQASMDVLSSVEVRDGATARLRYTTPLGELFVDITNPSNGVALDDGDLIPLARTDTAPSVEDTLASASLLINGGGLAQLQTVADELNAAFGGREETVRRVFRRTDEFLGQANATTADLDRMMRSLSSVSQTLNAREATINQAIRDVRPASRVLRNNTSNLVELLTEVENFSDTANQTVRLTREQLLTIIHEVEPVLGEFAANRDAFGPSLDQITRAAVVLDDVFPGDYLNLRLKLALDSLNLGPVPVPLPNLPPILNDPQLPPELALPDLGLGGVIDTITGDSGLLGTIGGLLGGN